MLIVKTPPIMAACPRGEFTQGPPWRRASLSFFCQRGPREPSFYFFGRLWSAVESRHTIHHRRLHRLPLSHLFLPFSLSLSFSVSFPISSSFITSPLWPFALLSLFLHPSSFHSFLRDPSTRDLRCCPPFSDDFGQALYRVGLTGWRRQCRFGDSRGNTAHVPITLLNFVLLRE